MNFLYLVKHFYVFLNQSLYIHLWTTKVTDNVKGIHHRLSTCDYTFLFLMN